VALPIRLSGNITERDKPGKPNHRNIAASFGQRGEQAEPCLVGKPLEFAGTRHEIAAQGRPTSPSLGCGVARQAPFTA